MSEHEKHPLAERWSETLKRALRDERDHHRELRTWRRYVSGDVGSDGDPGLVRVNVIAATMEGLVPHIYAQQPEVAVTAVPSVDGPAPEQVKRFARTLEAVVNRELEEAGLKRVGKRCVRSAMTSGIAWVKVGYQRDIYRDPHIERRIEDAQDNIRRLDALMREAEESERGEYEAKLEELHRLVSALEEQVEVVRQEGLVLDPVPAEDVLVAPDTRELIDYRHAPWIAHRIWMTPEQAAEAFALDEDELGRVDKWTVSGTEADEGYGKGSSDTKQQWVCVWEVWDKRTNTVYTLIQGGSCWARQPFSPDAVGEQWYPFFPLAFNWVEGERWPVADVKQWAELQDEYNHIRTKFRQHRSRAKPARIGIAGVIQPKDARKLTDPEVDELVLVDAQPGMRAEDLVGIVRYPPIDPALYDTSQIRVDLEMVSGLQDAARGAVLRAKTATEAQILQQGLVSRTTERQAAVEQWVEDIARYAAEVLLQELTLEQAQRIAGEGAVWPQLSRGEIYDLVHVEVRAGTTGRPDQRREQETWLKLLPLVQQTVQQVAQAEAAGQEQIAQALRMLLQETLRRFDETLDLDALLPPGSVQPQMPGQVVQLPQPQQG